MLTGVATGVANEVDAATATVIGSGGGETPISTAAPRAMGATSTAVAVSEMNMPVTAVRCGTSRRPPRRARRS